MWKLNLKCKRGNKKNLVFSCIKDAKRALHIRRLKGADGFIYRGVGL